MKKIFLLLAVVGMTFLQSCEGDTGPQGPTGYSAESQVLEITNVNFEAPSYGIIIPYGFQTLQSDHALVYRLSGSDGGNDVWQLLPQYYFFTDGTMNFGYNYDSTVNDSSVYLEGQDLGTLTNDYRLNQILRVVIVPGQFANKNSIGTDYNAVTKALTLQKQILRNQAENTNNKTQQKRESI